MLDMLRTKRADVTISDIDVDELAVGGDIAARLIASESVDNYRRIAKELLSAYEYKIFLCVLKGFKTAEIAQLLETTPKSVDNAKSRMWKSLRDHFGRTE
jgi:DNA-directed RNA polymerase specialized sigma24 family protein